MRSDAIDMLISNFLEIPARVTWEGALADSIRGVFEEARLELSGVAILALPFDRMVFRAKRFQFTPGLPARIRVEEPRIEVSVDQRQLDRWLRRARAPFALRLTERAIEFQLDVAGRALTRTETELRIQRGWFVLRPRSAEIFGLRARMVTLFRTYIPLPRVARQTRIVGIRHGAGSIVLELGLDDFEETITPGLVDRIRRRFLPFAR